MTRLTTASTLLALVCACDAGGPEPASDPWLPSGALGKADGAGLLEGSTIPSQFVDDDRLYLRGRNIDALAAADAVDEAAFAVIERADGILDSLPTNGLLEIEELVRMEEFPYYALMLPDEQDALARVWAVLETPLDPTAVVIAAPDVVAFEAVDLRTSPDALVLPESIAIADTAAGDETALQRLQQIADADGDPATVSWPDLELAAQYAGAFTPEENEAFDRARAALRSAAASVADARVAVPVPGETHTAHAVGPRSFTEELETEYREYAGYNGKPSTLFRRVRNLWSEDFVGQRSHRIVTDLVEGETMVLNQPEYLGSRYAEDIYAAGTFVYGQPAGRFVLEIWDNHERTFHAWVELPDLNTAWIDLDDYLYHDVETLDGVQLHRVPVTTGETDWSARARFEYQVDAPPVDPLVDPAVLEAVARDPVAVAAGRYVVGPDDGTLLIDVFPQGAVRLTYDGDNHWLRLSHFAEYAAPSQVRRTIGWHVPGSITRSLQLEGAQLTSRLNYGNLAIQLRPEDRDG